MSPSYTADQDLVRRINKSLVLNTIRLHAPISRASVANITGLNRSTISNIVNSLILEGLVYEQDTKASPIGRPSISLMLRPDGGAVIGVEIGVDFISVLLTNFVAEPLWQKCIESNPSQSRLEILDRAEILIDEAIQKASETDLKILGMGVGLPGLVNTSQGELIFAPNLGWRNLPLQEMWGQHFHIPVFLENEANLAALGEYYFGIARNIDNFIFLSSGIGLGGGIIMGGKLFRGGHGYAGEIGHMQRDPAGEICACGRRGCWETQVGPRAVLNRIQKALQDTPESARPAGLPLDLNQLTFKMVVEAAQQNNIICLSTIQDIAHHLAAGITDLVNAYNPEMIIIGGALSLAKDMIEPVISQTVAAEALMPSGSQVKIAFSERGKDACVYGAIAIVLDDIVRELSIV